jgi:hypothetical protein
MKNVMMAACCGLLMAAATPAGQRGAIIASGAPERPQTRTMDVIAEQYVKLVLALGYHDPDYVDAYYGPREWRHAAESSKLGLTAIGTGAAELISALGREREEARALYDASAPTLPESHFQLILDRLEKRFPGKGALVDRYDAFRRDFVIPRVKLDGIFQRAIQACRERTLRHLTLPADEAFTVEYVTGQSWGGYNG